MKRMINRVWAVLAVTLCSVLLPTQALADEDALILTAQGNPYFSDFQARLPKRADLRIAICQLGMDKAFTHWLREANPEVYKEFGMAAGKRFATAFQGSSYLKDFEAILSTTTHRDLQASVKKRGHDWAFMEWMYREHPSAVQAGHR